MSITTSESTNINLDDYRADAIDGLTPLQEAQGTHHDAINDMFHGLIENGMEFGEASVKVNEWADQQTKVDPADYPFDPSRIAGLSITDHDGARYFFPDTKVLGMRDGYMFFETRIRENNTGGAHTLSFRVPTERIASMDTTDTLAGNTDSDLDVAIMAGCFYDEDGNMYDEETYAALCAEWSNDPLAGLL